jgi:outer membrane receptor protein involved in Fe transport
MSKISLAVAAALSVSTPAQATEPADTSQLDEVVVTARKRTENLQDVPLSIDVFTAKDLQNLAISGFDDYAAKTPSVSYTSTGPGSQLFIMRGVSDGSNPHLGNTPVTGIFLDDIHLSSTFPEGSNGTQPDLHLYDIERIEVLNGPQGTTYGAGSMSGAIRYITNKPDVNSFTGGLDFKGGHIQGGQEDWTYEAFFNAPIIDGVLGLRLSAFSDSHGGYITNALTTRTWVNGTTSTNAAWAGSDFNREHVEGGRVALKGVVNDGWSATLTYMFQRQATDGAWDEDPSLAPRTVERFGPQSSLFEAKMTELHVDGDAGIGDLVYAGTYWSLPARTVNEYSQYVENYDGGAHEGWTCQNDPVYGKGPYTGCNVPVQYFVNHTNPQRFSNELRLSSKPGGRFHWLVGAYWEKTVDKDYGSTTHFPLVYNGAGYEYYNHYYGTAPGSTSLPPGVIYAEQFRYDYLQTTEFTNISFDITDKLNIEAGTVHFHSSFSEYSPYGQYAFQPTTPIASASGSNKWDSKFGINYKLLDQVMVYATFAQGFRDGGSNSGFPESCYKNGVPHSYAPDTINNFEVGWKSTNLNNHLIWNGAAYLMNWDGVHNAIYDVNICPPLTYYVNVGNARIYGLESNIDYKIGDNWALQAAGGYTDSHIVSSPYAIFQPNVGERLPYVPYFSWSANLRYDRPLPLGQELKGYAQIDFAHKGDMWNNLQVQGSQGLPRFLQPSYTIANLRAGVTSEAGHWLTELYVTNLFDKNAILFTNTGSYDVRETTNEPRVFGVRLSYRFGTSSNSR